MTIFAVSLEMREVLIEFEASKLLSNDALWTIIEKRSEILKV